MEELEKIDAIRNRLDVTYEKAKWALDQTNGDVINALILLEKEKPKWQNEFTVRSKDLFSKVSDLIREGNAVRLKIKHRNNLILEIPLTIGVAGGAAGLVFAPYLTIVAIIAGLFTHWTIEVERR